MEKIEIKYNNKRLVLGIIIMMSLVIGVTYMAFFTKTFATNYILKIVTVPLSLFMLYGIYTQLFRKVLDNNSVITLTKTHIEINEDGNPLTFSWSEIKDLRFEKEQSGKSEVDILLIGSDTRSGKVNLSALEKSVDDIRSLIKSYRG